jgi:hypothetical protein
VAGREDGGKLMAGRGGREDYSCMRGGKGFFCGAGFNSSVRVGLDHGQTMFHCRILRLRLRSFRRPTTLLKMPLAYHILPLE